MTQFPTITIVSYDPAHQRRFEELNAAWIQADFWLEEIDKQVLRHPEETILVNGGMIFSACVNAEVIGTVALKFVEPGVFEFTKMAVDKDWRGKGIGFALAEHAIAHARSLGAARIILYSHSKLKAALALYEKLGFKYIPVDGPYARSDVKMHLIL
jgi:GNAT superfamily N-acetyltransferase